MNILLKTIGLFPFKNDGILGFIQYRRIERRYLKLERKLFNIDYWHKVKKLFSLICAIGSSLVNLRLFWRLLTKRHCMYSGCMNVSKLLVSYLKANQNNLLLYADSALYKFQASIYTQIKVYVRFHKKRLCEVFISTLTVSQVK